MAGRPAIFVQIKATIIRYADGSVNEEATRDNALVALDEELALLCEVKARPAGAMPAECPSWLAAGFIATCRAFPTLAMSLDKALALWKGAPLDLTSLAQAKKLLPAWIRAASGPKEGTSVFFPDYRDKAGRIGPVFLRTEGWVDVVRAEEGDEPKEGDEG
jgi:hypothetical protein